MVQKRQELIYMMAQISPVKNEVGVEGESIKRNDWLDIGGYLNNICEGEQGEMN